MFPKEKILASARQGLALLDELDGQGRRYSGPREDRFSHADELQLRGIFQRLLDTAVGEGVSEAEAAILARAVDVTAGITIRDNMANDIRQVRHNENPFMRLLQDLRRYSLVKRDAIHIEIKHPQLPLDRPVELNSEALDAVYEALETRIEKLADTGKKGGLFLKEVFSDRTAAVNARGKFEAILRIIDLGAAEDLPLQIFRNSRYHEALSSAQDKAEARGPVRAAAEDVASAGDEMERGGMPRRGFFRAMSEAVLGAAIAPMAGPAALQAAENMGLHDGKGDKVATAMRRIKERNGSSRPLKDDELRRILEDVAAESHAAEAIKGAAVGGLAYYIAARHDGERSGDSLSMFLSALANECEALQYPVFQFGRALEKSSGRAAVRA